MMYKVGLSSRNNTKDETEMNKVNKINILERIEGNVFIKWFNTLFTKTGY
jgi:hypothetical protein